MQKNLLLLFIYLMFLSHAGAQNIAQNHAMNFIFNFRSSSDLLIKEYRDNSQQLKSVFNLLKTNSNQTIDSMVIVGSASPDGMSSSNKELSMSRAYNVWGFLVYKFPFIKNIPYRLISTPGNWQEVINDIHNDRLMPDKSGVIAILESNFNDPLVMELIKISYPNAYTYIYNHIIPSKRNAAACVVFYTPQAPMVDNTQEANEAEVAVVETDEVAESNISESTANQESEKEFCVTELKRSKDTIMVANDASMNKELTSPTFVRRPLFALKTNLLFDAATMLNVEVEIPIGKRFSIAAEAIFPWWLWENKQHCLQVFSGNLEGRYWLGNRDNMRNGADRQVMTGWFTGVYAGGGYYDLEWQKRGYQGEFFIAAGISAGYVHSIGRNLRMEYSIGVGYLQTNYRYYEARKSIDQQWHLYRQQDGQYSWVGPTRAKVSLVWLLNRKVTSEKTGR